MTKVSIVCITYNHEKYIENALNSFLSQKTNFDYEIIVCDDHSIDNTVNIIEEIRKKNQEKIKLIENKTNLGSMKNYLKALSLATSKYIAVCDGDDYWIDNYKLQKQVDFLDNNPDFSMVFHNTRVINESGEFIKIYPNFKRREVNFKELVSYNCIPSNSVMYRNCKQLTLRNDIVPLDHYIHLKYATIGKIFCMKDIMSTYRMHQNSLWEFSSNDEKYYDFLDKNGIYYLNYMNILNEDYGLNNKAKMIKIMKDLLFIKLKKNDYSSIELISEKYPTLYSYTLENTFFQLHGKNKFKKFIYYLIFEPKKILNKFLKKQN